ncbi:hypothetical protein [Vibrio profundi]|uniref:hypothetical protein n=1 Tax=Vibrio profundi TaxID=1774960 RepID=UPI003735C94C
MNLEQQRQASQLKFVQSGQEIKIGDESSLPLPLKQLQSTTPNSTYVVHTFESGLTAMVYHIKVADKEWTLKCKRPKSLVKNIDGETSFLNEVQRRSQLSALKQSKPDAFRNIVDTHYASYQGGLMLSPWIVGEPLKVLDQHTFQQIFDVLINLELHGLFEWDLCSGNILQTPEKQIKLFDFGYMYQFDPKTQFNSNGLDTPLFHSIERFETRFFFDYLLKNPLGLSEDELFELYRIEKSCALSAYKVKLSKLKSLGADAPIIERQEMINHTWETALKNDAALYSLLKTETFRSNVLDLLDDVHGKSCTKTTLKKADLVLEMINNSFTSLKENQALFFGDENLSQPELITKYHGVKSQAIKYQLN